MIRGCYGCGKSALLAMIALGSVRIQGSCRVLMTAETHTACDAMLAKVHHLSELMGLKISIGRLGKKSKILPHLCPELEGPKRLFEASILISTLTGAMSKRMRNM